MKFLKGFEQFYNPDVLLYLSKTLYGVKNAAKAFWRQLLGIMNSMGYKRNHADPCLYYRWDSTMGLIMWISFIDDMLVVCDETYMASIKKNSQTPWIAMIWVKWRSTLVLKLTLTTRIVN